MITISTRLSGPEHVRERDVLAGPRAAPLKLSWSDVWGQVPGCSKVWFQASMASGARSRATGAPRYSSWTGTRT